MGWGEQAARERLDVGDIIDLVERGEQYVIERAGQPVAVVLSIVEYRELRSAAGITDG